MGSTQSSNGTGSLNNENDKPNLSPASATMTNEVLPDGINVENNNNESTTTTKTKKTAPVVDENRPEGGMPLVNYVCRKKKKSYENCVSKWYRDDFLTGNGPSLNQEDTCGPKFELYRTCMLKGIKKEIWEKQNFQIPKEGSPLAEVYDTVVTDENEK